MLKKFEFYFHIVEILLWGLALLCNWHGSLRLDYPTSHAIFCPKGTENCFVFSAHAVKILILLYTLVGRQLFHSLGTRQRRYRPGKDHMLRKGTRDKRGLNRHMGTLSISVHKDKEGAIKTLLPRRPNTGGGQSSGNIRVTWPQTEGMQRMRAALKIVDISINH